MNTRTIVTHAAVLALPAVAAVALYAAVDAHQDDAATRTAPTVPVSATSHQDAAPTVPTRTTPEGWTYAGKINGAGASCYQLTLSPHVAAFTCGTRVYLGKIDAHGDMSLTTVN